ncbi:MAG TPA: VPLPA-CTERM sorting domain-containing protein [Spongiibacteraceae bacterium]|nr:VPLPA-CTERM sorting domain-containing protein [Spongiibacteraceae bacterium]
MKLKLISALAAGILSAAPAFAVTVDFQGAGDYNFVQDYYNGGTNDAGASGINYGISFGLDALVVTNDAFFTYYDNAPNPGALSAVGADSAMNVAAGFSGAVSFHYSATENTSVTVYSGLNGTGTALGTFLLSANDGACTDIAYCSWDFASLNLTDVAHSIQFNSTVGVAGFDNITIAPVPVPAAGWMMLSALGGLGTVVRRRRKA